MTSALAIGWTIALLNTTYTNVVPERHPGVALQAGAPGAAERSVTSLGERMRHEGRDWDVVRVNIPTQGVQAGKYLVDPGTREVRRGDRLLEALHDHVAAWDAEQAGIATSRRLGNARLVAANPDSPLIEPLRQLVTATFGVPRVLFEEFAEAAAMVETVRELGCSGQLAPWRS
jgi:hypothetical protein